MAEDPLAVLLDRLRQVPVAVDDEPAMAFHPAEAATCGD
jgi:hypothetical protein